MSHLHIVPLNLFPKNSIGVQENALNCKVLLELSFQLSE